MNGLAQDSSNVTFLGLIFLVSMCLLTWNLQRRSAIIPLLVTTAYMPLGQMLVIGGLHFQFFRILLLVGWCRVLSRNEKRFKLITQDKIFIFWAVATLILGTFAEFSMERFVNRCGAVYDALGAYFLFRCLIRDVDDAKRLVGWLSLLILPMAASMVVEEFTTHNIFSVFGGVPEITQLRDGRLRCQGAFRHPILAGTYAATLFPLCIGLYFLDQASKRRAILGAISTAIVVVASASSGALLALLSAMIALGVWPLRRQMRWIRRGTIAGIFLLALLMQAPVWYAFARLSEVVGGTGWYRSYLIDQAINHFDEWWFVGSTYTAHWAPAGEVVPGSPNNMDIINHYVGEGLGGGVLKLGLFMAMIVMSFKTVGRWTARKNETDSSEKVLIWSFGACLFAHCISFFSVAYFDQIIVMWYWLLAVMAMFAASLPKSARPVGMPTAGRIA